MRTLKLLSCSLLFAVGLSSQAVTHTPQTTRAVTLFEGARLIVGDGSAPIENSAFLVENNKFTQIGKTRELQVPAGAVRVDLTGKTVMPGLVELHAHLGYWNGPANTNLVENFTRENVLDHLRRFAYHGVAAVLSLGTDRRELAYQLRDELRKAPPGDTALYFTAGQGLSSPNAGPGFPMRPAVYEVTTEAEARKAVQEMVGRKVDRWLKIWHDANRAKLPPAVYRAIIGRGAQAQPSSGVSRGRDRSKGVGASGPGWLRARRVARRGRRRADRAAQRAPESFHPDDFLGLQERDVRGTTVLAGRPSAA